jgi:hypothetical protein
MDYVIIGNSAASGRSNLRGYARSTSKELSM